MTVPEIGISEEAQDYVRNAIAAWVGDNRDLALALTAAGNAMMLILDGRTDQIEMYEAAAKTITEAAKGPRYHG